jgi:integrase
MSLYKRGKVWWFEFEFRGVRVRESSYSTNKEVATKGERERRRKLAEGLAGVKETKQALLFSIAARKHLEASSAHWSDGNLRIETYNVEHLLPHFGKSLLTDITGADVSRYQASRKKDASARTINMEVGTLRAIMRRHRLWANIQPDVRMMKTASDIGRALSLDEKRKILAACKESRSRSLYPAALLSMHTGLRNQELRLLKWRQIDFLERQLTVGKSKTAGGEGRIIPLSDTATKCMQEWRSQFPDAKPDHYIFPSEKYGLKGEDGYQNGTVGPYDVRPTVAIGSWKVAWTAAKKRAGVTCRWHDLRHTFVSALAEGQASDATIMSMAGHLSRKMMERYSHTRNEAKRQAIAALDVMQ